MKQSAILDMDAVTATNLHRKQFRVTRPLAGGAAQPKTDDSVLLLDFQDIRLREYPDSVLSLRHENAIVSLQEPEHHF